MAPRLTGASYIPFPSEDPVAALSWLQNPANATFGYLTDARATIAKDYKSLFSDLRLVVQCRPRRIFDAYSSACDETLILAPESVRFDLEQLSAKQILDVARKASEDILRLDTSTLPWSGASRSWVVAAMHAGVARGIHSWMAKKQRVRYQSRLNNGNAGRAGPSRGGEEVKAGSEQEEADEDMEEDEPSPMTVLSTPHGSNISANVILKRKASKELQGRRTSSRFLETAPTDVHRLLIQDGLNLKRQMKERTKTLHKKLAKLQKAAEDFRKEQQRREEEFINEQNRKLEKYLQELKQLADHEDEEGGQMEDLYDTD